ncbi:hypothetical protein B0H15DRAFT_796058 [Mycena belliarum]|uniref:Uncharacterized protein n=1 Tax=Mycena belliarum TaxID=1033014 RepID=A0AAD6UF53_9AGAR|nr:hypothetical protein B0H15DRAFT_944647 [Mycena belliae]KAJ7102637.1 hypothetical protein B0H15DRAFT_796058 [Mycena belliae]
MATQFASAPTKNFVRPLLLAPAPVVLPVLLTNIIPEHFPCPRILTDIESSRTPSPPPNPRRAPTPAPSHRPPTPAPSHRPPTPPPPRSAPTPAPHRRQATPVNRESSLTPMSSDDDSSDSDSSDSDNSNSPPTPKSSKKITKPSPANISSVKELFKGIYPNLTTQERENEYKAFRDRLDTLCSRYLSPSLALSHQDQERVDKVYTKICETFPWLAQCEHHWPAAVCLQGKLHNSTARAVEKSTQKIAKALAGVASGARRGSTKPAKKR